MAHIILVGTASLDVAGTPSEATVVDRVLIGPLHELLHLKLVLVCFLARHYHRVG